MSAAAMLMTESPPPKPRNVVRSLPALSPSQITDLAYAEVRADPSLLQRKESPEWRMQWHAVRVHVGLENVAAAHLIARHFGVYAPVKDGKPLLPGYLFVFACELDRQWSRITSAPGVGGVLSSGERAAPIPDQVIDYLRAREAGWHDANVETIARKGTKGWRRFARKEREAAKVTQIVTDWVSALENAEPEDRPGIFERALGLIHVGA